MTVAELKSKIADLPDDTLVVVRNVAPGDFAWHEADAQTAKMYRTTFGDYSQFTAKDLRHRNNVLVLQIG